MHTMQYEGNMSSVFGKRFGKGMYVWPVNLLPSAKQEGGLSENPLYVLSCKLLNCPHQRTNMPIQFSRQENRRVILGFTGGLLFCLHIIISRKAIYRTRLRQRIEG